LLLKLLRIVAHINVKLEQILELLFLQQTLLDSPDYCEDFAFQSLLLVAELKLFVFELSHWVVVVLFCACLDFAEVSSHGSEIDEFK